MRAIKNLTLICIIVVLIALPGAVGAQTSNVVTELCRISLGAPIESSPAGGDWPMFRHDAQHTGYVQTEPSKIYIGSNDLGIHALNSANCSRLWRFQTGGPVKSSPAVRSITPSGSEQAADRIYVGSDDGKLYALAEDGSPVWIFNPPSNITLPTNDTLIPGAFRSSPMLLESQERIFIGNDDGLVYSINMSDDRTNLELIRFPSAPPTENSTALTDYNGQVPSPIGAIRSSPVFDNLEILEGFELIPVTQIYFTSMDRRLEPILIDPEATIEISSQAREFLDAPSSSSPAVGLDNLIFTATSAGTLYSTRPDFVQQWRVSLDGDIVASPAVSESGTVFIGTMNGTMYGVRPNGTVQCTFKVLGPDGRSNSGDEQLFGIRSSAAVTPDGLVVFGADDGYLYVIEGQTCKMRAFFKTNGPIVSSPMVAESENNRRKIFFGSGDGFFYALTLF